ncbi:hypothetical protein RIR_jg30632.t1 [Rhizophagus irregularis DAOM 181602=DAOM 197198]|uniref:Uncharacterized protein n=1 Tax=Rhizophagus irregularis (strain DAOM 181602 / DAOM 197198 / MUCL 43194) TaxID=747089 RepID=U9U638_RHIID|nr:hypothetical protein RIR_jg30632.t1 [Rhizophagus irregularis DAOM 181602=DAOM 197198]
MKLDNGLGYQQCRLFKSNLYDILSINYFVYALEYCCVWSVDPNALAHYLLWLKLKELLKSNIVLDRL